MSSPNFDAVRKEISGLFDPLVVDETIQENLAYLPLKLEGQSPVVSVEDQGFSGIIPQANWGQYNISYALTVRVNRSGHGASLAQDIFDDVRERMIAIVTETTSHTNMADLSLENGAFSPVFVELHDGLQYIVGQVLVTAVDVACSGA